MNKKIGLKLVLTLAAVMIFAVAMSFSAFAGKRVEPEATGNSNTFEMKVARNHVCSCSSGKIQGLCPDCNPLTQSSCTTCGGAGYGEFDCPECDGKGAKTWTDTISVTVNGEIKAGSTLTAVNNTSSVPVNFDFCIGGSFLSNPYTIKADDAGKTLMLYCEATTDKWENLDNIVTLGTVAVNNECYLDLESSTTDIPDSKSLDQNYQLTVTDGKKTDVTKVKLSWTISDINAVRKNNKVWDAAELKWVDKDSSTTINDNGTASFELKNYSSVKMSAAVSFEAVNGFKPGVEYSVKDGRITLDTANGNSSYSKTNVPAGSIGVTVTPGDEDFKNADETTAAVKYGTYTVTISAAPRELYVFAASSNGAPNYKLTVNGAAVTVNANHRYSVKAGDKVALTCLDDRNMFGFYTYTGELENMTAATVSGSNVEDRTVIFTVPNDVYNYAYEFGPENK